MMYLCYAVCCVLLCVVLHLDMGNDEWCVNVSIERDGGFFLLGVLFYVVVLLLVAGVIESR